MNTSLSSLMQSYKNLKSVECHLPHDRLLMYLSVCYGRVFETTET